MSELFIHKSEAQYGDRHINDLYVTPPEVVRAALVKHVVKPLKYGNSRNLRIVDLGAGPGVWGAVARYLFPDAYIIGFELMPEFPAHPAYDTWYTGDILNLSLDYHEADVVMFNPPFKKAASFVRVADGLAKKNGSAILALTRLGFLASEKRRSFFSEFTPYAVNALRPRPSFYYALTGKRNTDGTEYAIMAFNTFKACSQDDYWLDWDYDEEWSVVQELRAWEGMEVYRQVYEEVQAEKERKKIEKEKTG